MTQLSLEVGKSYVKQNVRDSDPLYCDIAKIVGTIDRDTLEYEVGYRFFSHIGTPYSEDGRVLLNNDGHQTDELCLSREAVRYDIKLIEMEVYRIDLRECQQLPNRYIPVQDPRFSMHLSGVYINRMGFIGVVDTGSFLGTDEPVFNISGQTGICFTKHGRTDKTKPTMHDIAFRRI